MCADLSTRVSQRSRSPITAEHLARLSEIASQDRDDLSDPSGKWLDYRGRQVLVVLAQGGAQHYLGGSTGVKDLDVWSFFARVPGHALRSGIRHTHKDFGRSELGRQRYHMTKARSSRERSEWEEWSGFAGRRVDLFVRDLPVDLDADFGEVLAAVRAWLKNGITVGRRRRQDEKKPSGWWLAHKPGIVIDPVEHRGETAWTPLLI